jgi:hypothetical protein
MATPRFEGSDPEFSLFPFLSVLVGVIGTMTLIISGMSLVGLQKTDQVIALEHDPLVNKEAVFVECRQDGLLLHPEREFVSLQGMGAPDGPWRRRVRDLVADKDRRYLVLLVRPDGIDCFRRSLSMAKDAGVDVGFDPVYATGEIRFRKK